jgi:hypothetical protein
MRFTTRRTLAAVAVIGAVAAGSAAYTAGSGFGSQPTASYAGTIIEGVQATGLQFQYSNDGSVITEADMLLVGDYSSATANQGQPYTIRAGFGTDTTGTTLAPGLLTSTCTATAFSAGSTNIHTSNGDVVPVPAGDTGVSCPFAQLVSDNLDSIVTPNTTSPSTALGGGADQFNLLVTSTNPTACNPTSQTTC